MFKRANPLVFFMAKAKDEEPSLILVRLAAMKLVEGKPAGVQVELLSRAGLSVKEIARILDKTENTVRVTLSLAKKRPDKKSAFE